MAGEAREILTVEELHRRHVAPETIKQMVSNGAFEVTKIDLAATIQHCDSCKHAKATQKPIKKFHEAPRAAKFGDEIHSDVWGHPQFKPLDAKSTM